MENYLSGEGMELVDVAEKAAQSTYSRAARQAGTAFVL
jgi:hypothetical protein